MGVHYKKSKRLYNAWLSLLDNTSHLHLQILAKHPTPTPSNLTKNQLLVSGVVGRIHHANRLELHQYVKTASESEA